MMDGLQVQEGLERQVYPTGHPVPFQGEARNQARLENWLTVAGYLMGDVYGHPGFPDGREIRTAEVQSIDYGAKIAVTQNTIYRLGTPYPMS